MSGTDNVAVIVRDKTVESIADKRRQLSAQRVKGCDSVCSLMELLTAGRERSREEVLQSVQRTLDSIIFQESTARDYARAVPFFVENLCAEKGISALLQEFITQISLSKLSSCPESEWKEFVRSMSYFLGWYVRRTFSVATYLSEVTADDRATIFGTSILHDRKWGGVAGLEVLCGALLRGVLGDSLWLRVRLEQHGKLIYADKRWEEWKEGVLGLHAIQPKRTSAVACLVPIAPDRQQVLLDRLSTFIPYGAIEACEENEPVTAVIEIIDRKSTALVTSRISTFLRIPSDERQSAPIFSPMSRGIWSEDLVSLDRIFSLCCKTRGSVDVQVSFDLEICSQASHRRELMIECRFLDHFGRSVQGMLPHRSDEGALLSTLVVKVNKAVQLSRGLTITIPLAGFDLDVGEHNLFCEVVVVAERGELLCGAIEPCVIKFGEQERPLINGTHEHSRTRKATEGNLISRFTDMLIK